RSPARSETCGPRMWHGQETGHNNGNSTLTRVRLESPTYNSFTCTFRKRTLAPLGQAPVPPWTWQARCPLSSNTSSNFLSLVYSVIFVPLIQVVIVGGFPTHLQRTVFHLPCFQIF